MNEPQPLPKPGFSVRYTEPDDAMHLKSWFLEPGTLNGFPMMDEIEIDDAALRWVSFCRYRCSLTLLNEGVPCGIATLYLQPYRRIAHQCEFGIVISSGCRGKGLGKLLMRCLMHLAKETFHIELLHLQVYQDNPAIQFYEKLGFTEFGRQTHWVKEGEGKYAARIFMEKFL